MALLLSLADKRQKDLTDYKRKEQVLSALSRLKVSLPPFCETMKKFVRDPNDVATQVSSVKCYLSTGTGSFLRC